MHTYYNSKEVLSPRDLAELQTKQLCGIVNYVYKNSIGYNRKFKEAGIRPEDIKSLDDLQRLPLTNKNELPYGSNNDLMSVPLTRVAETHQSSGSTGNPIKIRYTQNDVKQLAEMNARCLYTAGTRKGDAVQNAYVYGLFTGGLGIHYGAMELGAGIIPTSVGDTNGQINIMQSEKPATLACTARYANVLAEEIEQRGLNQEDISWKQALFGAEPCSDTLKHTIEDKLGIEAYNIYGLSEMGGPGVAVECGCHAGLHIWTDLFYPEIIAKDGELADEGEKGELVLTTLSKEAMPLIRYNTHDITSISYEKCACGITMPTIAKIEERSDNMLIINGINVYPAQVEKTLSKLAKELPIVGSDYQLVVNRQERTDKLEIRVGLLNAGDKIANILAIADIIADEMKDTLKIRAKITLVSPCDIYLDKNSPKSRKVINAGMLSAILDTQKALSR